jgi:hypothetical protein
MLTAIQLQQQRRRRSVASLKQQYQEYLLQRIEAYKNSLSRRELLALGDEAVSELGAAQCEQFLLTEVLIADSVDRLIHKRLALQPYKRWSKGFRELRAAQREPTRWGIERRSPITQLLPRLEPGDTALVLGVDAAPLAYLLAAHDVSVTFCGDDMTHVDQVESRVADEALGHCCGTYVAPTGQFPPDLPSQVTIVIMDTGVLDPHTSNQRRAIIDRLMERTAPCGVHLLVPSTHALAPEAYLSHYGEWIREDRVAEKRKPSSSCGVMLGKPPMPPTVSSTLESRHIPA